MGGGGVGNGSSFCHGNMDCCGCEEQGNSQDSMMALHDDKVANLFYRSTVLVYLVAIAVY
jgi:hypothetical protein